MNFFNVDARKDGGVLKLQGRLDGLPGAPVRRGHIMVAILGHAAELAANPDTYEQTIAGIEAAERRLERSEPLLAFSLRAVRIGLVIGQNRREITEF